MAKIDYTIQKVGSDKDNLKSRLVRVGYTVDEEGWMNTKIPIVDVADFRDEEEAVLFQTYLDSARSIK